MATQVHSRLLAGTGALLTATAVTVSGMTSTDAGLPSMRVAALENVKLAALANPLLEIYDTIQKANLYLFSIAEPPTTTFDRAGIIPDFLAAGFPILTQYATNAPDYVNQAINYAFQDYVPNPSSGSGYPGALRLLTWAVDALPANIGYAAQQVFGGNLVGAFSTLGYAVVKPIQAALYQTLNAGMYALGGVGVRAAAVITAIADWVPTAIRHLADDVTVVLNAAGSVVSNVLYGIQTGNPEAVWNSLVIGVLGTAPKVVGAYSVSIPDALINQTIGEGGRIYTDPATFTEAPSIRQDIADLRTSLTDALATDVPVPEDPPFPVYGPGGPPSQIPTPWQQTPYPASARSARAARSAAAPAAVKRSSASAGRAR